MEVNGQLQELLFSLRERAPGTHYTLWLTDIIHNSLSRVHETHVPFLKCQYVLSRSAESSFPWSSTFQFVCKVLQNIFTFIRLEHEIWRMWYIWLNSLRDMNYHLRCHHYLKQRLWRTQLNSLHSMNNCLQFQRPLIFQTAPMIHTAQFIAQYEQLSTISGAPTVSNSAYYRTRSSIHCTVWTTAYNFRGPHYFKQRLWYTQFNSLHSINNCLQFQGPPLFQTTPMIHTVQFTAQYTLAYHFRCPSPTSQTAPVTLQKVKNFIPY